MVHGKPAVRKVLSNSSDTSDSSGYTTGLPNYLPPSTWTLPEAQELNLLPQRDPRLCHSQISKTCYNNSKPSVAHVTTSGNVQISGNTSPETNFSSHTSTTSGNSTFGSSNGVHAEDLKKVARGLLEAEVKVHLPDPPLPNIYITTNSSTDCRLRNLSKTSDEKEREEALRLYKKLKIKVTEFNFPRCQAKLVFYPHEIDFEFIMGRDDTLFMAKSLTEAVTDKFRDGEFKPDNFRDDVRKLIVHTIGELYVVEVQKLLERQRQQRDLLEEKFNEELRSIVRGNKDLNEILQSRVAIAKKTSTSASSNNSNVTVVDAETYDPRPNGLGRRRSLHHSGPADLISQQATAHMTNASTCQRAAIPNQRVVPNQLPQRQSSAYNTRLHASTHPTIAPHTSVPTTPQSLPQCWSTPYRGAIPPLDTVLATRLGTPHVAPRQVRSHSEHTIASTMHALNLARSKNNFIQTQTSERHSFYRSDGAQPRNTPTRSHYIRNNITPRIEIPNLQADHGLRLHIPASSLPPYLRSELDDRCFRPPQSAPNYPRASHAVPAPLSSGYEQRQPPFYYCQS